MTLHHIIDRGTTNMADIDSTSSNIEYSGNNEIVHGSMIVEGNLQVDT